MSASDKKKMCWSCDGNVPLTAQSCPFCGVTLDNSMPKTDYKPPYRLAKQEEAEAIPVAPILKGEEHQDPEEDHVVDQTKKVMLTLACLSVGIIFLFFGVILFLFSGADGMLVLRWDAHYWYLYLIIGLPLLIVGWRSLGGIVDLDE